MSYTKAFKALLISVIGWFIVRLVMLHYISNINLFEAHDIAVNLVQTGSMKYFLNNQFNYNYQFPVYPYLLFLLYKTFGIIPKSGIILNLIFHSIAVILSLPFFTWVAEQINSVAIKTNPVIISLLSSLVMLFHPLLNYYTIIDVHPFATDLFFLMCVLYCIMKYSKTPNTKNLILLGIVFGLAMLDRPTFVICIIPLYLSLKNTSHKLKKVVTVLGIGMIILVPWLYRNYTIYNKLTLTSSTGQNLWIGIQQQTGGSTTLPNGDSYYKLINDSEWKTIGALNSEQQSDYFLNKYKQAIENNPGLFIKMYLIKIKNFWLFRNDIGSLYSERVNSFIPIYKCIYFIMLVLAIGLILLIKRQALLIFSVPLALSLIQSVFYVETRHRIIIEPLLAFMAIGCIFIIIDKVAKRKYA